MYLQATTAHWAIDIEADNLLEAATRIWCACVINLLTKEEHAFTNKEDFLAWKNSHKKIMFVGHNAAAYDVPMLNKFWGAGITEREIVDTFVLSQMYSPTFKGGHSLEAWGLRLRYPKGDFNDFSEFTPEMLSYCKKDVRLTGLLFLRLTERMRQVGFTEDGCRLEMLAWWIIQNKQRRNGFPFNYKKAQELYVVLRAREEELKNEIYRLWPPRRQAIKTFAQGRKKDGERTTGYLRHLSQYPELRDNPDGSYTAYDDVCFNLGSPPQRIEKLLELGWKPVNKTKSGNPKVDEDELLAYAELSGTPEVKALAKWIVVNSRANMVNTWLNAYDETTGCIHGRLFIASTLRYRHSGPNSANIPRVRLDKEGNVQYGEDGAWTYECRDLFDCGDKEEFSLVGIDAKGVQLRVLANYIDEPSFTEAILSEDPHTANMKTFGLTSRSLTKTITYATLMAAGDARIANEAKVSLEEAKRGKAAFFSAVPSLPALIKDLQSQVEKTGRIKLCDGTPILVSSPHMVIPYLLQGDESRLMKLALIFIDTEVQKAGLENDVFFVANIHDEIETKVRVSKVDEFIKLALPCFIRAGEFFKYKLPIEGDAQVGKTWSEAH